MRSGSVEGRWSACLRSSRVMLDNDFAKHERDIPFLCAVSFSA